MFLRVSYEAKLEMIRLLTAFLWLAAPVQGQEVPFKPLEKGLVGNVQDPVAGQRVRINQGYASSVLLGDSVGKNRLFSCPQMVGPIDGKYYCRGKEFGYCDRRSGTCFCNDGFMGESCNQCDPTHFELGGLCYPKIFCPNDCSNAGVCNFLTGQCVCENHREGDDCSTPKCSTYHEFCTHCNDKVCLECEQAWSVMSEAEMGAQCAPCHRFDPRCLNCNSTACISCVDLLLFSIHRSGRRPQDPPLPIDELNRELSVTVPFGSTQEDAFYDAEYYFLVDEPNQVPLKEFAIECHQGLNSDDSIDCMPYNMTSHIICGNHGTITFVSPEYAVREDEKHIRLTLQRSGGGVGEASVTYTIYPITAGYEDVTSTAQYTTNQTVVFRHGQIRASFLVTINDDRMMEQDETFSVHLVNPTGGATLGTQQRTIVTVIDDDKERSCSSDTFLVPSQTDSSIASAGVPFRFTVNAVSCAGDAQTTGGDKFKVEARRITNLDESAQRSNHKFIGSFRDNKDGTYQGAIIVTSSGHFELDVYQLIPGGLKGSYFTDAFLSESSLDLVRTDATVNFTFGTGPIAKFARDFVSVRWTGTVKPLYSETYTFWLDIDEQARLWIDDELLIDWWAFPSSSSMMHAEIQLTAYSAHDIVLEYRDISGNATAKLLWSSESTPLSVIPSSNLMYKEKVGSYNFTVLPASVSAQESTAAGQGIHAGIAGKELTFTMKPNDAYGNFRGWPNESLLHDSRHLDNFQATATLINSNAEVFVPVNIFYNGTSRYYQASYIPTTSGVYDLSVKIDSKHIFGSPFVVDVQPGATFAPQSIAHGGFGHCPENFVECSGLYHGMAGRNSTFIIDAYDIHKNKRHAGGDDWTVTVSNVDDYSDYHYGSIEDFDNGTYAVSVIPIRSGLNELNVKLNGSHVRGSPFEMKVVANENGGSATYLQEGMIISSLGNMIIQSELP